MTDSSKPEDQPQSPPSQPAGSPKRPERKPPPEIKPDDATRMYFQGSQDAKKDHNLVELVEGKKGKE